MVVNNYKLNRVQGSGKQLTLPVSIDFSDLGQEQSIELYEETIVTDIVGAAKDFETSRFSHKGIVDDTSINYNFYFYSGSGLNNESNWVNSFSPVLLSDEIIYDNDAFTKSFFKLDFYDTTTEKRQKNYLTLIMTANKSSSVKTLIDGKIFNLNKPSYSMDYGINNDGFFLYWFADNSSFNINTFYLSCKFYNAKIGSFVRMSNQPQSIFSDSYDFDYTRFFYYKLIFNPDRTYQIFDLDNNVVGSKSVPINWFEYRNP